MGEIYQSLKIKGMRGEPVRVNALIDTGANINVVSTKFAKKFHTLKEIDSFTKVTVHFADKHRGRYPQIFLMVLIKGEYRVFPFVVIDNFGNQILLGVRFLQDTDKTIDFKNDRLNFRRLSKRKGYWL